MESFDELWRVYLKDGLRPYRTSKVSLLEGRAYQRLEQEHRTEYLSFLFSLLGRSTPLKQIPLRSFRCLMPDHGSLDSPDSDSTRVGLCATCAHRRLIHGKSSTFIYCLLSKQDATFARYPRLPMLKCSGFTEARGQSEPAGDADR